MILDEPDAASTLSPTQHSYSQQTQPGSYQGMTPEFSEAMIDRLALGGHTSSGVDYPEQPVLPSTPMLAFAHLFTEHQGQDSDYYDDAPPQYRWVSEMQAIAEHQEHGSCYYDDDPPQYDSASEMEAITEHLEHDAYDYDDDPLQLDWESVMKVIENYEGFMDTT